MSSRQPYLNARLQGFGTTIFTEMTRLAIEHNALNLGQGFPDFDGPESVKEAAIEAIRAGHNQYCRMAGQPPLTQAIAAHQERFYGLRYDPLSEVTVYSGATEAIFATLQALCEVGDEIVLFEPFYDSYRASVMMAGATPRMVTLRPPDFTYDPADPRSAAPTSSSPSAPRIPSSTRSPTPWASATTSTASLSPSTAVAATVSARASARRASRS